MRLTKPTLIVFIVSAALFSTPIFVVKTADAKAHKVRASGKTKKHSAQSTYPGNVWDRIRTGIRIPVPNPGAGIEDIAASPSVRSDTTTLLYSSVSKSGSGNPGLNGAASQSTKGGSAKLTHIDSDQTGETRIRQILLPHKSEAASALLKPDSGSKYTKLGQALFSPKNSESPLTGRLTKKVPLTETEKLASAKSDSLFKKSIGRIQTRLGLHSGEADSTGAKVQAAQASSKGNPVKPQVFQSSIIKSCGDLRKKDIVQLAKEGVLTGAYTQMAQHCREKQAIIDERIAKQVAAYSKGFLHGVSERARPYLFHIVDTLNKYGLPLDLALLPIMESAYQSTAMSPANASGLWQFIPSTGRLYGLDQTENFDERRDVVASTQAAARFLSSLNGHYKGDWLLALAAYNWGPGNVDAAIARNHEQGLDTDYWSLEMPAETQNYVPRLLALARIFSNPAGFGLNLRPLKNEPYFIRVTIDREKDIEQLLDKDLSEIANLANFQPDVFQQLNSAYLKPTISKKNSFSLLMPISNANILHRSLAFLAKSTNDENRDLPYPHAWALSSRPDQPGFEMPWVALNLSNDRRLSLFSYETKPEALQISKNIGEDELMTVHYLEQGETLKTLADYHGVSEEKIREVNKIKRKQKVAPGQRLMIPMQASTGSAAKSNSKSMLYQML